MVVEMITKEDLQQFRQQLLSDIKEIIAAPKTNNESAWLRSAEARQILKVSAGTLQNLRISGQLKPNKIGGTYYYNRGEIMDLLAGSGTSKRRKL
ncbi:DNA-binding protein [Dyadobacter luteus]|uniref:DNA-binding protein n=1 Tax=Dyadobacter luteus TaxID=2259619 RepID=A0A3D8Y9H7_9BACT|nr:helix-turn-helix domain-containing protein [Dyadobacter luteus]REA60159.1 DNA-binding protein [Dyadobacter luteus]